MCKKHLLCLSVVILFLGTACSDVQSTKAVGSLSADKDGIKPPPPGSTDPAPSPMPPPPGSKVPTPIKKHPLTRGEVYVRNHEMMVSGLVVQINKPTKTFVDDYLDLFNANTIHLWLTGLNGELRDWHKHRPQTPYIAWVDNKGYPYGGKQVIGGLPANYKGRVAYQVGDEPRTFKEYEAMKPGLAAVRAADPDALVYLNFSFSAKELQPILDDYGKMDADIISYDQYTNSQSGYAVVEMFRKEGLKYNRPYWRYTNLYDDAENSRDPIDETDARWDAFKGLTYGYTGLTWFIYQIAPSHGMSTPIFTESGSQSAEKTVLYGDVAQINREVANLGQGLS